MGELNIKDLSPAESQLLLHLSTGARITGFDAVAATKLSFRELLLEQALRLDISTDPSLVPTGLDGFGKDKQVVVEGGPNSIKYNKKDYYHLFFRNEEGQNLLSYSLPEYAARTFPAIRHVIKTSLRNRLIELNLASLNLESRKGIFKRKTLRLTPAGTGMANDLRTELTQATQWLTDWRGGNPAALQYAYDQLGANILLVSGSELANLVEGFHPGLIGFGVKKEKGLLLPANKTNPIPGITMSQTMVETFKGNLAAFMTDLFKLDLNLNTTGGALAFWIVVNTAMNNGFSKATAYQFNRTSDNVFTVLMGLLNLVDD